MPRLGWNHHNASPQPMASGSAESADRAGLAGRPPSPQELPGPGLSREEELQGWKGVSLKGEWQPSKKVTLLGRGKPTPYGYCIT